MDLSLIKDLSLEKIRELLIPASEDNVQTSDLMDMTRAAVLISFFKKDGEWHLLFIRRTNSVQLHKGQVAFPGGVMENHDNTIVDAALRESYEEVGLNPKDVNVLGILDPVKSTTNYIITPVIGSFSWPYDFVPSNEEVDRIFSIPLAWLADASHREERLIELFGGVKRRVIFFQNYDNETLWGISAHITVNLLNKLNIG